MSEPKHRIVLDTPTLILVMGVAASGKTALSKGILGEVVATYLDNNFVADAFFAETRTDPEYLKLRGRLYSVLYRVTEENLTLGNSVLLDVPHVTHMQDPSWRGFLTQMVDRTHTSLRVIRCRCDEQTLRTRIEARGERRDDWKLENWNEFLRREPIDVDVPFPHLEIDTGERTETNVDRAVTYIRSRSA